jgi:TPR repeat protein
VGAALFWYRKAFRGGASCAASNMAITYRQNGKMREAVKRFKAASESRDDGAFVQIGIHLYWGIGVRKDPVCAARLFRRAIKGKDISEAERDDAHFYLGLAYLEGKGVRKSLKRARALFERSNEDGDHPAAQRVLRAMVWDT